MRILKIINNNVISALDEWGTEIVAMGRGIGFQKKAGQEMAETAAEKIFRLESPTMEQFEELIVNMPLACVQVSDEIISYGKTVLAQQLSQSVYLTLTDHIHFAITRFHDGVLFENALYNEIRRFYPDEFDVGQHALELIEKRTGVRLPQDEAASIAFHLVNAEYGLKYGDIQRMSRLIRHLIGMVGERYPLAEDSLETDRLRTNLKFILNRLLLKEMPSGAEGDSFFSDFIRKHCVREYELAEKMKDYIEAVCGCKMTDGEVIYLTIQLKYTL